MFLTKRIDGKKYWTHSSLLADDNQAKLNNLKNGFQRARNVFTFATFYLMLEAVNRLNFLKIKNFYYRSAFVLVPTLFSRIL